MIKTDLFGEVVKKLGFTFFCGVPCSFLTPLIHFSMNECEYITAVNEGEAVAMAAGANIGGRKSVVLMQNSGLCNAISPLTSLVYPFKIPILGFISYRGEPGLQDEPQHELMGQITGDLLSTMKIQWEYLSLDLDEAIHQLTVANEVIEKNKPFFFIVRKGTFEPVNLGKQAKKKYNNRLFLNKDKIDELPTRLEALQVITRLKDNQTVQLTTTGKTGRELYELDDADNNLYMVGSMGCIGPLALGLSIAKKNKQIIVIDGDGALLMRMGSMATIGANHPQNLLHILLDNNSYDSTGGQLTISHNIDFVNIAASCGYENAVYIHSLDELECFINKWKMHKQLTFLHLKIAKGSKERLGRPKMKPFEIKERLQVFMDDD